MLRARHVTVWPMPSCSSFTGIPRPASVQWFNRQRSPRLHGFGVCCFANFMGVSKNSGFSPKSSIKKYGFPLFSPPIFGNTHIGDIHFRHFARSYASYGYVLFIRLCSNPQVDTWTSCKTINDEGFDLSNIGSFLKLQATKHQQLEVAGFF